MCCSTRALSLFAFLLVACTSSPRREQTFPSLWSAPVEQESSELPKPLARGEGFRRGFVIGPLLAPEQGGQERFQSEHEQLLDRAREFGATDLELIVRWRQASATATEVMPFDCIHDEQLTWLIKEAQRRKLRVWLAPTLAVGDGDEVEPARAIAPRDWDAWWWSYRRVALHYARFAAYRRVDLLSIGADLEPAERDAERWEKLIRDVRKVYRGQLTYVARAERLEQVPFWSALDVVALSVEQPNLGSEKRQRDALSPLSRRLERAEQLAKRGYLLVDGGCGAGVSTGQSDCQRALFQSFRDDARLRGVYLRTPPEAHAEEAHEASSSVVARHWFQNSKTW